MIYLSITSNFKRERRHTCRRNENSTKVKFFFYSGSVLVSVVIQWFFKPKSPLRVFEDFENFIIRKGTVYRNLLYSTIFYK